MSNIKLPSECHLAQILQEINFDVKQEIMIKGYKYQIISASIAILISKIVIQHIKNMNEII